MLCELASSLHQQLHSSSGHQIGNFTLHFQPFYGLLCPASRSAIDVLWMFLAKHIVARIPHFPGCWNIRSFVNAFSLSTAFCKKKRGNYGGRYFLCLCWDGSRWVEYPCSWLAGAARRKFPMIYRRGSTGPGRHTWVAERYSTNFLNTLSPLGL